MLDDAVRNGRFRPNTGDRPGTIFAVDGAVPVTTDDHPFWNVTDHQ